MSGGLLIEGTTSLSKAHSFKFAVSRIFNIPIFQNAAMNIRSWQDIDALVDVYKRNSDKVFDGFSFFDVWQSEYTIKKYLASDVAMLREKTIEAFSCYSCICFYTFDFVVNSMGRAMLRKKAAEVRTLMDGLHAEARLRKKIVWVHENDILHGGEGWSSALEAIGTHVGKRVTVENI